MGGKTYRTKIPHSYLLRSGTIEALDRDVSRFDGVVEAAVTAVDSFFDVDFLVGRGVGSLNSDGRWEEVTATMEENCVQQERRFNRRELHWETLYRMPIIGHRSFTSCDDSESASYGAPKSKPARGWMRGNSPSKYLVLAGRVIRYRLCVSIRWIEVESSVSSDSTTARVHSEWRNPEID